MSTIPTSLTEEQFSEHVYPYVSKAHRGYECQIPLWKVFNYILYRLHTGCQWKRLPIDPDPGDAQKKRLAGRQSIIIFANGVAMVVYNGFGNTVSMRFDRGSTFRNSSWMGRMRSLKKAANRSVIKAAKRRKLRIFYR